MHTPRMTHINRTNRTSANELLINELWETDLEIDKIDRATVDELMSALMEEMVFF